MPDPYEKPQFSNIEVFSAGMRIAWRKRHEWSVGQPGQLAFMLRLIMGRDIIYTWCFPSSARVVAA